MSNTNCLEGLQCPSCGQESKLKIECLIVCGMTDDGTEDIGDPDFTDKSWCCCPECEFEGEVQDFRLYRVFNATDKIYATDEEMHIEKAQTFMAGFYGRFAAQGYYRTAQGENIPVSSLRLQLEVI